MTTRRSKLLVAVSYLIFSFTVGSQAYGQAPSEQQVTIDQVLNEVQKALTELQTKVAETGMPPLESATLTLETEVARKADGSFTIFIFTFGKKWEKEMSQELVLELTPPEPYTETKVGVAPTLSKQLVEAVLSAVRGVQEARVRKPPLILNRLETVFTFVVTSETNGGVKFEIKPVSAELKGDLKQKALHKIALVFKKPKG
jgi:hypothetical protein